MFAWGWIALAGVVILLSYGMTVYARGFAALQDLLSPFNIWNSIAVAITLAPGLILLTLAERLARGQRFWGVVALFPVSLALVGGLFMIGLNRPTRERTGDEDRMREYEVTGARVKNASATMYQHKNLYVTQTSAPVGSDGIPGVIRLGDRITVKGHVISVRHIFVSEYLQDMKWGSDTLARKGDVACMIVESKENLPYGDEKRDRLWIHVKECEPFSG